MNILFFIGGLNHPGGIERVTTTLANELVKRENVTVTILCHVLTAKGPIMELSPSIKLHALSSNGKTTKPHSIKRVIYRAIDSKKLRDFLRNNQFDVIISQAFPLTFMLWSAGISLNNVFCCEHVHYNYYGNAVKFLRKSIYKNAARIVTLTTLDKKCFDRDHDNCLVIPNPFHIPPQNQEYDIRSTTIVAAGRLCEQKGFDRLIAASKLLADKYPDWHIDIWGQGHLENNLKEQIQSYNLNDFVHLCGSTDDMQSKYQKASFFVLSSRFEGFPMVIGEALSYGLPVVSFDCPNGPSDFITNGYNGLLVENGDIESFAQNIETMIMHPELRAKMNKVAPDSVRQYSVDQVCNKWLQCISDFLNPQKR